MHDYNIKLLKANIVLEAKLVASLLGRTLTPMMCGIGVPLVNFWFMIAFFVF